MSSAGPGLPDDAACASAFFGAAAIASAASVPSSRRVIPFELSSFIVLRAFQHTLACFLHTMDRNARSTCATDAVHGSVGRQPAYLTLRRIRRTGHLGL